MLLYNYNLTRGPSGSGERESGTHSGTQLWGMCGILCHLVARQKPTWRIRPKGREELSFLFNGMYGLVNRVARREGLIPEERRVSCGVRASSVWNLKIQGEGTAPSH